MRVSEAFSDSNDKVRELRNMQREVAWQAREVEREIRDISFELRHADEERKKELLAEKEASEQKLVKDLHVKKQSSAVFFNSKGEIVDVVMDPSIESIGEFFDNPENNVFEKTDEKYVSYTEGAEVGKKSVLFFHADWCSTCRKWEKNLQANIDTVSDNVQVFKVNYDKEGDMRKKYKITKQSQAVFLDAEGNVVKTEGDPSLDSINSFFNEV